MSKKCQLGNTLIVLSFHDKPPETAAALWWPSVTSMNLMGDFEKMFRLVRLERD